ncbi:MAG: radical SAM protein [Pseudomonadota bacterium]
MGLPNISKFRELLDSEDPFFHDVGIQEIFRNFPDSRHVLFDYFLKCTEEQFRTFKENLKNQFPFLRNSFRVVPNQPIAKYTFFTDMAREYECFLLTISQIFDRCSFKEFPKEFARFAHFPGIRKELGDLVDKYWGTQVAQWFDTIVNQHSFQAITRQLMLFLSYRCNLSCPYCFASDCHAPDMAWDQLLLYLDWAQENKVKIVTLCGGEPTIYPHFVQLLGELQHRGLTTYFATNLLGHHETILRLKPSLVHALIVHVSHRYVYTSDQWTLLKKNIKAVQKNCVPVGLRINIFATDHNWDHLFELVEEFKLEEIQLAFAFPNGSNNNKHVHIDDIEKLIPDLVSLLGECDKRSLRTVFSKPIPLCLLPEPLGQKLLKQLDKTPSCSVYVDDFTHNMGITPDGRIAPCLGLLDISKPHSEFSSWQEIKEFNRERILPLLTTPLYKRCETCFLYDRGICQGLCLGHKKMKEDPLVTR